MKRRNSLLLFAPAILLILFVSCGDSGDKARCGKLTYAIEYPALKKQPFMYEVLPKQLTVLFTDNRARSTVAGAGIENSFYANHANRELLAFFKGDGPYYAEISEEDIHDRLLEKAPYEIIATRENDTLAGLQVHKALAVDSAAGDTSEVWYTDDLALDHPNWYNRFRNVPGVLVRYRTEQFGLKMEVSLTRFEAVTIPKKDVTFKKHGTKITYDAYNKLLTNLFNSFQ